MEEVVIISHKYQGAVRCVVSGAMSTVCSTKTYSTKLNSKESPASFVYPNPVHAGSELTVSPGNIKNADEIRIVSSAGQLLIRMKQDKINKSTITIPSHFAAGMYFVQIVGKNKILKTAKLVVVR